MLNAYSISQVVIIGVYLCAVFSHGLIYLRLRNEKTHGTFALLCLAIAAYAMTNVVALHFSLDLERYIAVSKLSSVFAIATFLSLTYFVAAYLELPVTRMSTIVTLMLLPFFVLNLVMPNGILWSGVEGVAQAPGPWENLVNKPVGAVISYPMYGLWFASVAIYLWLVRVAFHAMRVRKDAGSQWLFAGFNLFLVGLVHDILIDMGTIDSSAYVSEYLLLGLVVAMSLRLSNDLYRHKSELEVMVTDRTKELEEANRDLEAFSYSISHDLRAPLRAISGFTKAIQEEKYVASESVGNDYFQRIVRNVHRMDEMINGMLQLSRAVQKQIVRTRIDLTGLARELFAEYAQQNPDRAVSADIEEDLVVYADPVGLRVILANLVDNAWKFTMRTPSARISVRRYSGDPDANGFVLSDNGAGFEQKWAEKLFVPFQRLHSSDEYPGFGIGLATVARIVRRHGGEIRAQSAKGEGATFYVLLGNPAS